ncbi:type I-E CRISPR-associated protein Cse1/CasA [Streptomyces sp. MNP-20]|uniref:type I-E CRISPR-associated protein Cse1/CasA n=1 Tax=Streptomyces sp. MNP-20 TaxID=2721165 RepID=UPI0028160E07|nr:type I-E CRISPR-associated protein Cse1/CasA [Streptomyces sp. MNP-20]
MHPYPLDTAAWLPPLWASDARAAAKGDLPERVGLRAVLERSHEISALAITEPPAYAAVLRVLYPLTARVCALDVEDDGSGIDWSERRLDILEAGRLPAEGIDAYFAAWAHRFDLFDPVRPWMQDPRLAEQCDPARSAGVNKLVTTRASGNNHSWFGHVQDADPDPVSAGEAALSLLTWHYYGPAGRGSARKVNGESTASMMAGPLRGSLSYHPEGTTLFASLLAGLLRPDPRVRRETDRCPWEQPDLPDPAGPARAPQGPCSRLTAVSQHALLLVPDPHRPDTVSDAFITWAHREGRLPRTDPYLMWQISQENNPYPRPADAGRALWRDLDALLLAQPGGTAQARRPEVFDSALELSDACERPLAVRALGFDQDGRAKDRQFVAGLTPPVLDAAERQEPGTAPAVGWLRRCGEMYGRRAEYAVRRACALYMRETKPKQADAWAGQASGLYWPRAEEEFWSRFAALDRTGALLVDAGLDRKQTRRAFLEIAEAAFDTVTRPVCHTQRGARAVADARTELYGGRRTSRPAAPATPA